MSNEQQNFNNKVDLLNWMKDILQTQIKTNTVTTFLDSCLMLIQKIFSTEIEINENVSIIEKADQFQKIAKLNGLEKYFFDSNSLNDNSDIDSLLNIIEGIRDLYEEKKFSQNNTTILKEIEKLFIQSFVNFTIEFLSSEGKLVPASLQLFPTKFTLKIGGNETYSWRYHKVKCDLKISKKPLRFILQIKNINYDNPEEVLNKKPNKKQKEPEKEKEKEKEKEIEMENEKEKEWENKEELKDNYDEEESFLLQAKTNEERIIIEKLFLMFKTYWGDSIESHSINGNILGINNEINLIVKKCIQRGVATFYAKIKEDNEPLQNKIPNSTLHFNSESFLFHSPKNNQIIRLYWDEVDVKLYNNKTKDNELILEIGGSLKKKRYIIICINTNTRELINKCFIQFQRQNNENEDLKENQNPNQDKITDKGLIENQEKTDYSYYKVNNEENKFVKIIQVKLFEDSKVNNILISNQELAKELKIKTIKQQRRNYAIFNKKGIGSIFQSSANCPFTLENKSLSVIIHSKNKKQNQNNTLQLKELKLNQLFNKQNAIFHFEIFYNLDDKLKSNKKKKIIIHLTSIDITITIIDKNNNDNDSDRINNNNINNLNNNQPKFEETYSKMQKLFLHPINNTSLIFISSNGQNLVIVAPNTEQRDLFFNLFVNFRTNFLNNKNKIKIPIPHLIISSHLNLNNTIDKRTITITNHLKESIFNKIDPKNNDQNKNIDVEDRQESNIFQINLYSSLEAFVGQGLIKLFEEHFVIAFHQIILQRYYNGYSKIFYNKNFPNYLRLNIDENLFIIFSIKDLHKIKLFIKIFNEHKKNYLKYYLEPTIYFECLLSTPNRGNFKSSIDLTSHYFKIQIPFNIVFGEYLIETKAQLFDPKQSLRTVKITMGGNQGYLLISFANSIQSLEFINTFNNLQNRYIACANNNILKKFTTTNAKKTNKVVIFLSNNLFTVFEYNIDNDQLKNYYKHLNNNIKIYSIKRQPNYLVINIQNENKLKIIFENIQEKKDFINSFNIIYKKKINHHNNKLKQLIINDEKNNKKMVGNEEWADGERTDGEENTNKKKDYKFYNYGITFHKNKNLLFKNGFLRMNNLKIILQIENKVNIMSNLDQVSINLYPMSGELLEIIINQQIYLISFRSISLHSHFISNFGKNKSKINPKIRPKGIFYPAQLKIISENNRDDKVVNNKKSGSNVKIGVKKIIIGMKLENNCLKMKGKDIHFNLSYHDIAIEKDKIKPNKCHLFHIKDKRKQYYLKFMDSELLLQFCHMFNYHAILNIKIEKIKKINPNIKTLKKIKNGFLENMSELKDQNNDFKIYFLTDDYIKINKGFLQLKFFTNEIIIWNFKNNHKKIFFKDLDFLTIQKIKNSPNTLSLKELDGEKIIFKMKSIRRINQFLSYFKKIVGNLTEEQNSIFSQRRKVLCNTQNNTSKNNFATDKNKLIEDENVQLINSIKLQNEKIKFENTNFKTKEVKINHTLKHGIIINVSVDEKKIFLQNSEKKILFEFYNLKQVKFRYPASGTLPKVQLNFIGKKFNFVFFSRNQIIHFKKLLKKLIYLVKHN
ncbi:hypothetical protein M0812_21142 [Anaeramoeba flamelloides]|uniref:Uncharacterized protein n=1 Tax=Anaeramoeba flamelloides TaxID=1746091 RepID=A0AAV7YQZ5_9EUKA|nr:hypothetical protein M0812_21142 [Anaeramoeba flamelloides]